MFCSSPANPVANNQQGSADASSSLKESIDDNRVLIYPNPTTGVFTLENTRFLSEQNLQLEIYSMLGKRIMSENIIGEKKHLFNLGNVPNGIYLVRIIAGEQVETIKLVKQ